MKDKQKAIIVAGATGNQGAAVIRALSTAKLPFRIVGLTRNPDGKRAKELQSRYDSVTMVKADVSNLNSLQKVFDQVGPIHGIFSVQNYWIEGVGGEGEVLQGMNLIKAAEAHSELEMFVYSSTANADRSERDVDIVDFETKWEIEQHLAKTQLPYLIVRPVQFMQNFFGAFGGFFVADKRSIGYPGFDRSSKLQNAYVDLNDHGALIADAFKSPRKYVKRTLVVASDKLTPRELEDVFNKTTGAKAVATGTMDMDEVRKAVPDLWVLFDVFRRTDFKHVDLNTCKTYMPQTTSFEEFLIRQKLANKYVT